MTNCAAEFLTGVFIVLNFVKGARLPSMIALALFSAPSFASDTGHTAWMLRATALDLFMTIPGLSLFYAGLVRAKNVLSVLMQCFAITGFM